MKVVIAGGGTGGHLFPGIAIAEAINERYPTAEILFISTKRAFDATHLTLNNFRFQPISSPPFSLKPTFPIIFLKALISSVKILKQYQPNILIGLGGFGSVPPILAAIIWKIPFVILEQNYVPGKANRLLARWSKGIYSQWAGARKFFVASGRKFIHSGSPLRNSMRIIDKNSARCQLGISPEKMTISIVGGSQGASALNTFMLSEAEHLRSFKDKIQIIHLTGKDYETTARKAYSSNGIESYVQPFTNEMALVYSATDLIISRAGGIALQEIAHYGIPAILIPYPFAAENHQLANAREVEKAGGAIVIEEKCLQKGTITKIAGEFLSDSIKFLEMGRAIQSFAPYNAKNIIVNDIIGLCREVKYA